MTSLEINGNLIIINHETGNEIEVIRIDRINGLHVIDSKLFIHTDGSTYQFEMEDFKETKQTLDQIIDNDHLRGY